MMIFLAIMGFMTLSSTHTPSSIVYIHSAAPLLAKTQFWLENNKQQKFLRLENKLVDNLFIQHKFSASATLKIMIGSPN